MVFLGEIIAEHLVVSPGETSINDDHYGGARPMPRRSGPTEEYRREDLLCASARWPTPSSRERRPGG